MQGGFGTDYGANYRVRRIYNGRREVWSLWLRCADCVCCRGAVVLRGIKKNRIFESGFVPSGLRRKRRLLSAILFCNSWLCQLRSPKDCVRRRSMIISAKAIWSARTACSAGSWSRGMSRHSYCGARRAWVKLHWHGWLLRLCHVRSLRFRPSVRVSRRCAR